MRPTRLLTHLLLSAAAIVLIAAPSAVATGLRWSAPTVATRLTPAAPAFISCPSSSFCAGLTAGGTVYTTTAPTAPSWGSNAGLVAAFTQGTQPPAVSALACPSAGTCVETDAGSAHVSSDPAHGGWSQILPGSYSAGAACPSTQLCVLDDDDMEVFTSTDPTAGAKAKWQEDVPPGEKYDPGNLITTPLACPDTTVCLYGETSGVVWYSPDPTGGSSTWRSTAVAADALISLSCPSAQLCIAVDAAGATYASTDPAAGTWQQVSAAGAISPQLQQVSCAAATFCLGLGVGHVLEASSAPAGGASTWAPIADPLSAGTTPQTVSCAATGTCYVAGTGSGGAGVMAALTSATSRVPVALTGPGLPLTSLACPSAALCVGATANGEAVTSSDPTGSWSTKALVNQPVGGLSCPSTHLCVLAAGDGSIYSSTAPAAGSWHRTFLNNTKDCRSVCGKSEPLTTVACASAALCWTDGPSDEYGQQWWSSTNGSTWRRSHAWDTGQVSDDPPNTVSGTAIACASAALCIGTGATASAEGYSGTGVYRAHRAPLLIHGIDGTAAACGGLHLCVILAGTKLYASTQPAVAGAWHAITLTSGGDRLTAVSCPSAGLCVIGDSAGRVAVATHPAGGTRAWTFHSADPGTAVDAVSCPSTHECVISDSDGRVVVGRR